MSLVLLFPLGLAALAAWALPLLLHLARREQRTPTDFAALRWLAIRARPRTRLRFDELTLLATRLALLAAIAFLLARPATTGGDENVAWEVLHPAAPLPASLKWLKDDGVEKRWLAPGFPPLGTARPAGAIATSSLLRQLDAELPAGATLTVHVPAQIDGVDGERPRLSRPVQWRVGGEATEATTPAPAPPRMPVLAIRHDSAHAAGERWLRAVAIAWQAPTDAVAPAGSNATPASTATATTPTTTAVDSAPLEAPLPARHDLVLAWLADGALPAPTQRWVEAGGTALLAPTTTWPLSAPGAMLTGDDGEPLAEAAALGKGRIVRLQRELQPAAWPALLEATFPRLLRDLVAAPMPMPARADAASHAPLEGGPGYTAAPREFPMPLAWLVLALFALERWLATGRRPEAGA